MNPPLSARNTDARSLAILAPMGAALLAVLGTTAPALAQTDPATWTAPGPGFVNHETGAAGEDIYLVLHQAPSLARYQGEVAGLAATSTGSTGASRLNTTSASSLAYLGYLASQHAALVESIEIELGRVVEVSNHYDAVLNGIAIEMTANEAAVVSYLPGVRWVERNTALELLTDNGPRWIGADAIWGEEPVSGNEPCVGTCGEGIVVGIIDTGINYDHPSFADIGGDGYDHTNPRGLFYGLCDPLTGAPFCNDKLIGLYDFSGLGVPEDDNGHGSHTASTTAGNVILDAELSAPTVTLSRAISGVAPHANIIAYKSCNAVTGNCLANGILGSINQATLDMVDVINFSIGGSSSNPWADLNAQAFFDSYSAGIFVAAAAGNEGPGFATMGSPADAPWVTAIGASTHDRAFTKSLAAMGGGDTAPPADIAGAGITQGYGSAPIVYAGDYGSALCGEGAADPTTGASETNPFPPGTFNGEIVVCDRGTYGRVAKGENVAAGGAGGYVLANDAASGNSLVADPHVLPGIHISYDDGVVLKAWLASGAGHTATITPTELPQDPARGDLMAGFSSRGVNPSVPDVIKPDVAAPGVNIFAAWMSAGASLPGDDPEYSVISGTSMASPHTAGAAALVRAIHPDWNPDQVKSALMTTAFTKTPGTGSEVHDVFKEDGATPADPFDMGGGRVDLRQAADAGLILSSSAAEYQAADPGAGGSPRDLNIASFGDDNCIGVCSWTRTVEATVAATWSASTSAPTGMVVTVSPSAFSLLAGQTQTITVTANVADVSPKGQWTFAQIALTPSDPSVPASHLPLALIPKAGVSEVLHLHGNLHDGCTGSGAADVANAGCQPFLSADPELDTVPAAKWGPIQTVASGTNPQNIYDPNWIWVLEEPTTIGGSMVVEWWAGGPGHNLALGDDFYIRLFADGVPVPLANDGRVSHNIPTPNVPAFLSSTLDVPQVTASSDFVIQIDPVYVNQNDSFIYYDSTLPCPGAASGVCDSRVSMPVIREPSNDPPVANDDNAFVDHAGTVVVDVLANDFDPDGDPLAVELVSGPLHGTADLTLTKTIQYTHDGSATTTDSLVYRITDIVGQSDTATVTFSISQECVSPTSAFSDDFESGAAGWTVDTAMTNSGAWALVSDTFTTSPSTSWFTDAESQDPVGVAVVKDDRLVSPPMFVSTQTHLTFWHRYGTEAGFDGGVLEVSTNDGATWQDVEAAGGVFVQGGYDDVIDPANEGNPLQGRSAWTGSSDATGTVMVQVDVDLGALGGNEIRLRWRLGQDEILGSPNPPFGWFVDDVALSFLLEVDPDCEPGNLPPDAWDDSETVPAGGSVNIVVKDNDSDPDNPNSSLTVTIESAPTHGTAEVETDGSVTYTHDGDGATADSFQYRLTDPDGAFDIANVNITIVQTVNQPPDAVDDDDSVSASGSVTVAVKANDSDPDDPIESLVVSLETSPDHGTAGVTPEGEITYTHNGNAATSDSFEYRLTDPHGAFDIATVTIGIDQEASDGRVHGSGHLNLILGLDGGGSDSDSDTDADSDSDDDSDSGKVDFSFDAKIKKGELKGKLKVKDKRADVKIDAKTITSLSTGSGPCNGQALGSMSWEFTAEGKFEQGDTEVEDATFRVCGEDNGKPGKGNDRFFVECLSGCSYDSGSRVPDDVIDGGNIHIHDPIHSASSVTVGSTDSASRMEPGQRASGGAISASSSTTTGTDLDVLDLQPMLLDEAPAGSPQLFVVVLFTDHGLNLDAREVTLTWTDGSGARGSASSLTNGVGVATFWVTMPAGNSEFFASAEGLQSNGAHVTGTELLP